MIFGRLFMRGENSLSRLCAATRKDMRCFLFCGHWPIFLVYWVDFAPASRCNGYRVRFAASRFGFIFFDKSHQIFKKWYSQLHSASRRSFFTSPSSKKNQETSLKFSALNMKGIVWRKSRQI